MSNTIETFKSWSHKVLPLVYDDSLSYYEVLCKIHSYLNNVINTTNTHSSEIEELKSFLSNFNEEHASRIISDYLANMVFMPVSAKDFGAVGDGVTDNYEALTNFINHIVRYNLQGFIPEGTYYVSNSITYVGERAVRIFGAGIDKTIVKGNGTEPPISLIGSQSITLSDFTVDGNSVTPINGKDEYYITTADRSTGIQIMRSSNVFVDRVKTINCSSYGMYAISGSDSITTENIHFNNCFAEYCWCGFQIQGARNSSISNCSARNITRTGANFKVPVDNCTMSDITTENCGLCGVNVGSSYPEKRATNCAFNNLVCKEVICGMYINSCENCVVDNILVKIKDIPGFEGVPVISEVIVPNDDTVDDVSPSDVYTLGYGDMYIREKEAGSRNGVFMSTSKNNYITNAKIQNVGSGCACVRMVSNKADTLHNYVKLLDATTQAGGKIVIISGANNFVTENNIIEVPSWFDVGTKVDGDGNTVAGTNFPFPEPGSPNYIKIYGGSGGTQYVMESPVVNERHTDSAPRYTLGANNTAVDYIEIVSNKNEYIIDTITGGYLGRMLTLHTTSGTKNAVLTAGGNIGVSEDVTVSLNRPVTLVYTSKGMWVPIV